MVVGVVGVLYRFRRGLLLVLFWVMLETVVLRCFRIRFCGVLFIRFFVLALTHGLGLRCCTVLGLLL